MLVSWYTSCAMIHVMCHDTCHVPWYTSCVMIHVMCHDTCHVPWYTSCAMIHVMCHDTCHVPWYMSSAGFWASPHPVQLCRVMWYCMACVRQCLCLSVCLLLCVYVCLYVCISVCVCSGETALRDSLSQFETAYLSKSLSRLIDPINLVFSSSSASPPTDDEIDGVVKVIARSLIHFISQSNIFVSYFPQAQPFFCNCLSVCVCVCLSVCLSVCLGVYVCVCVCVFSEWSVTSIDSRLAVSMSKNIAKTVVFFCTKSEQMVRHCHVTYLFHLTCHWHWH